MTALKQLLIVSDDESIRTLFCSAFSNGTVTCEAAEDVDDAINRIKTQQYAIVAVDLASGGTRTVELLNDLQHLPDRPLIFVLADDTGALPHKLDPKVVTMVIAKPFDTDDIRTIIRQTLISLASVAGEDTLRGLDEMAVAPAPPPSETAAPAAHVLVVDDDRMVLNLIVATLRREGLDPDTAGDGAQAIEKLQDRQYCAIVLDLMMPKMSGWDVIDWFKKNPEKIPYSVIVSTAADRSVLHELDPEIVNAIFVKPFNTSELAGYVRACANLSMRDRRRKRVLGIQPEIRR